MKKAKESLTAQKLRWILVGIIIAGIVIGAGGVFYLNSALLTKITAMNDAIQSATVSKNNLGLAQALKTYVGNHATEIEKASLIVAQTKAYHYQNQIVEDITKYANSAGVSIVGFDFPQDITSATVDKTTGLKSLTATITLASHASYTSYMRFLKYIEQNLTKIQITDVTISPDAADQNYLNDQTTVGIQVYVQ